MAKIFCKTLCSSTQKETTRVFYRLIWGENLWINYKEDADHQMLSIAKHSTIEEIYVEQEEKKTYQYPWYNI